MPSGCSWNDQPPRAGDVHVGTMEVWRWAPLDGEFALALRRSCTFAESGRHRPEPGFIVHWTCPAKGVADVLRSDDPVLLRKWKARAGVDTGKAAALAGLVMA